jgi:hypothetical protein
VPFWIHQLVELLLGMLLLVQGARTGEHTAVLVTLGGVLLLLALCSDGALAAWPWIGRRLHRVLDLVAAAVLALSPLALGLDHVLPIVILEVAAAAMVWLALRTEWRTPVKRSRTRSLTRSKGGRAPKASASGAVPPSPPPVAPPRPATPAAPPAPAVPLARKVGGTVGKARDDGPRQLGRLVGKAQRAAKAAMAPDSTSQPSPTPPVASPPSEPPERPSPPPNADPPN